MPARDFLLVKSGLSQDRIGYGTKLVRIYVTGAHEQKPLVLILFADCGDQLVDFR